MLDSFAAPCIVTHQALLSMRFSRQEDWSGLPFPSPVDLPHQGSNLCLLHWQADYLSLSHVGSLLKACTMLSCSGVSDSATAWTAACQALCPWGFSKQEYWSGLPLMPDAGNSLAVQQLRLGAFTTVSLGSILVRELKFLQLCSNLCNFKHGVSQTKTQT